MSVGATDLYFCSVRSHVWSRHQATTQMNRVANLFQGDSIPQNYGEFAGAAN